MPKAARRTDIRGDVLRRARDFARGETDVDGLPFEDPGFDDAFMEALPEVSAHLGDALHAFLDAMQDEAASEVVPATSRQGERLRIDSRLFFMPVSGPAGAVREMLIGHGLRDLTESLKRFGFVHRDARVAMTTVAMSLSTLSEVGPGRLRRALWASAGEVVPGLERDEARPASEVLGLSDDPFETLPGEARVMRVIMGVRVLASTGRGPLPHDYLTTNGFVPPDDDAMDDAEPGTLGNGSGERSWLDWAEATFQGSGVSFGGPQSWFEATRVAAVDAVVDGLESEADILGVPPNARNGTFHYAAGDHRLLVGLRLPDGGALGPVEVRVRSAMGGECVIRDMMSDARDAAVRHRDAAALVRALTAPLPCVARPRVPRTIRTLQLPVPVQ